MARKLYIARNCENMVNDYPCPIIFVPGVMGTRLNLPNGDYKWDPDDTLEMGRLAFASGDTKRKIFDADANAAVIGETDLYIEEGINAKINPISNLKQWFTIEERRKAREVSEKQGFRSLAGDFYRGFLMDTHNKFKDYKMPIYAVGYDWRQSNWISGEKLAKRIDEILKIEQAEKCIIVTHSMGGLVTRAAIKQSKDLEAKVVGVIHVVQPVFGATVLYRRFFTGATLQYDSTALMPSLDIANRVFFMILGDTPRKFSENMSSLQGPLELLPTDSYNHLPAGGVDKWLRWEVNSWDTFSGNEPSFFFPRYNRSGDVYDEYASETKSESSAGGLYNCYGYDSSVRKALLSKLNTALEFHQQLGSNDRYNRSEAFRHPNTYAIAGTGLETDVATEFDLKFESVKKAITYSEYQFTTEERYQPALERIKQFSRVPMAERNKFVADILRVISDHDFARLTTPIKPPEGDGTVPIHSAWGLFPAEANDNANAPATFNPSVHRQLTVSGVEHGGAYQSGVVTSWVHKLIVRLRNSPEMTQAVEKQEKLNEKGKEEFIRKERLQKKVY